MRISFDPGTSRGPLGKIVAALVGLLTLVLGVMFSLVFVVVVVVLGLLVWAYFWWKTRALRRQLRDSARPSAFDPPPAADSADDGRVIDGEAVRVVDEGKRLADNAAEEKRPPA